MNYVEVGARVRMLKEIVRKIVELEENGLYEQIGDLVSKVRFVEEE